MTPERREKAMDELERLGALICSLRADLDDADPDRDWQDSIR